MRRGPGTVSLGLGLFIDSGQAALPGIAKSVGATCERDAQQYGGAFTDARGQERFHLLYESSLGFIHRWCDLGKRKQRMWGPGGP